MRNPTQTRVDTAVAGQHAVPTGTEEANESLGNFGGAVPQFTPSYVMAPAQPMLYEMPR